MEYIIRDEYPITPSSSQATAAHLKTGGPLMISKSVGKFWLPYKVKDTQM